MEHVLDLEHDGKKGYVLPNGKAIICQDFIKQKQNKAFQVQFRASSTSIAGGDPVVVKKVTGGWTWPGSGFKYPLIIYKGGCEMLDSLFPDAVVEDTRTVWLKTAVTKNRKD